MSVWDSLEQGHRESIITDISELVHQQLVTSSLGGTFRDTLENQMQVSTHGFSLITPS